MCWLKGVCDYCVLDSKRYFVLPSFATRPFRYAPLIVFYAKFFMERSNKAHDFIF